MDIDKMKAGVEMDALVAERVMDEEWIELSHDDVNWFQSLKDYELDQK